MRLSVGTENNGQTANCLRAQIYENCYLLAGKSLSGKWQLIRTDRE